jgi:ribosomal protein S18 acetylase RimI-like enzyme
MRKMIERAGPSASSLWWARSGRKTLAVALAVESPGHTAGLFFSRPDTPGVDRQRLVELIAAISQDVLDRGVSMVQSLIEPHHFDRIEVLIDSGMFLLANLLYLARDLMRSPPDRPAETDELVWRSFEEFTEAQLADVISRTYAESLDCPALRGVRRLEDVITGHKSSGIFCPEAWWIVGYRDQPPAGCILVNDSAYGPSSDIIYIGLAPEFRRRGLARAMLNRAIGQAADRSRRGISVAVDTDNPPAMSLYQQAGFIETNSRLAYAKLKTRS